MDREKQELARLEEFYRGAIEEYEAIKEKIDQCVFAALSGGKTLKEAQQIAEEFLGERKEHAWAGVQYWGNAISVHKAKIEKPKHWPSTLFSFKSG